VVGMGGSLGIRIMLRGDRGFCLGVLHRTFVYAGLVECNCSLVLVCFQYTRAADTTAGCISCPVRALYPETVLSLSLSPSLSPSLSFSLSLVRDRDLTYESR
jgi:hypothetical protein